MSHELRDIKLGEIEANAARERAAVEYIDLFVKANEAALRDAFITDDVDEDEVPAILYDSVVETLKDLSGQYVVPSGVMTYNFPFSKTAEMNEKTPAVKLGWAKYHPVHFSTPLEDIPEGQAYPHVIDITPAGMQFIDSLRAAQGYVTLSEKRDLRRQEWDRSWGREEGSTD